MSLILIVSLCFIVIAFMVAGILRDIARTLDKTTRMPDSKFIRGPYAK